MSSYYQWSIPPQGELWKKFGTHQVTSSLTYESTSLYTGIKKYPETTAVIVQSTPSDTDQWRLMLIDFFFISGGEKGAKCVAERAQCPAYSVQDGYKHAS